MNVARSAWPGNFLSSTFFCSAQGLPWPCYCDHFYVARAAIFPDSHPSSILMKWRTLSPAPRKALDRRWPAWCTSKQFHCGQQEGSQTKRPARPMRAGLKALSTRRIARVGARSLGFADFHPLLPSQ